MLSSMPLIRLKEGKNMDAGQVVQIFVAGIVTIGVITALTLPGRQTVGVIKAGGDAGSNLLGTAIKG